MRKTWEELTGEIDQACKPYGIEWHELRRSVVNYHLEENPWPAGEGLGSSDQNHILVGEWQSDETRVRQEIVRLHEIAALRKQLVDAGVDMNALARLFEPLP